MSGVPPGRVAMVAYTRYSSDSRVRRHVDALVAAGYAVDVFTLREQAASPAGPGSGGAVRFFPTQTRRPDHASTLRTLLGHVRFLVACAALLVRRHRRDGPYALVHVNNMPNFLVVAGLPLRWLGTPLLLDIHDTVVELVMDRFGIGPGHWATRLLRLEERLAMRAADFVLTSEHTKLERLRSNGLQRERSAVVLNLPDRTLFPEVPLPAGTSDPDQAFRLVYHGTLADRLGVDVAVEAVHHLRDRIPGIRFDIIGDGEQRSALARQIESLALHQHVTLSDGFVPTPELPALLEGADLAVLPSRDGIGTELMLPTKLLEYVQLGIPAVTVPTRTIRHYFDADQLAFVPSDDPVALADQIHDLWLDPCRRRRQAEAARRFNRCHPSSEARDRYLAVVAQLARPRAARGR